MRGVVFSFTPVVSGSLKGISEREERGRGIKEREREKGIYGEGEEEQIEQT